MLKKGAKTILRRLIEPGNLVWVILGLVIIVAFFTSPYFFKPRNLRNVFLIQPIGFGLAALGQSFVVISGGIDLSVGAAISLMTSLGAGLMKSYPGIPPVLMILIYIAMGTAVGAINGFIVVILRVTPIMATLATMNIFYGLTLFFTKRTIGGVPSDFRIISDGRVWGTPVCVIWFLAVLLICYLILNRNKLGKYIYSVGSDAEVSRLSGINVPRTQFLAYVIGGILVGLAAAFLTARLGGGGPEVGRFYELQVIAAIVIGGVSLAGGRGNLFSVVGGVLILTLFANIMNLLDFNPFTQIVLQGLVLILAVAFYSKKRAG